MTKENEYRVGDEVTIKGVVTSVGDNGGNPEYTVAINNPNSERPISIPPKGAPQLQANSQAEVLELNAKRAEEVAKENKAAQKELDDNADDEAGSDSDPEEIRKETATPDPKATPAGNASAAKPATLRK